jgi:hypothetical protein
VQQSSLRRSTNSTTEANCYLLHWKHRPTRGEASMLSETKAGWCCYTKYNATKNVKEQHQPLKMSKQATQGLEGMVCDCFRIHRISNAKQGTALKCEVRFQHVGVGTVKQTAVQSDPRLSALSSPLHRANSAPCPTMPAEMQLPTMTMQVRIPCDCSLLVA